MENLKKFFVAISLTILLAGTVMADCPPPIPGELNTPPCTTGTQQVTDDSSNQSTTTALTAPLSSEVEILTWNALIAGLENLLTIY